MTHFKFFAFALIITLGGCEENFQINIDTRNAGAITSSLHDMSMTRIYTSTDDEKHSEKEIKLSAVKERISLKNIVTIENHAFKVKQTCAQDGEEYFEIDKELLPYIDPYAAQQGTFKFKDGNYKINGILELELATKPVNRIYNSSTGTMEMDCVAKDKLMLDNEGQLTVNNLDINQLTVENRSIGYIVLNGTSIKTLHASNESIGNVLVNMTVQKAYLHNSSLGNIDVASVKEIIESEED